MKIGYARVSKDEQNLDLQFDALAKEECKKVFSDKITGSQLSRKGLDEALEYIRKGDTLVIWKLDRLGRSLKDLISIVLNLEKRGIEFCSICEKIDTTTPAGKFFFHIIGAQVEYERAIISMRTKAGLAAARSRGRLGGRKKALNEQQIKAIKALHQAGEPIKNILENFNLKRSTLYKYLKSS